MISSAIKIKARGNSMAPFLLDGDDVFIKKSPLEKLYIDDIVSFLKDGKLITHRLVFINKNVQKPFFITKGDFNNQPDGKVYEKQLVGKVMRVKRKDTVFNINDLYKFNAHYYLQEINTLLSLFNKNRINYIILKGLPLYLLINKKIPNRIFADCDILIDKKDFINAHKQLTKLGYLNISPIRSKINPETTYNKVINHFKITFDIHTELCFLKIQKSPLNMLYPQHLTSKMNKEFFVDKQSKKVQGIAYNFLNRDYLFIYLVLHLYRHNFRGYNRYQLISDLLANQKVNFDKVYSFIAEYNLTNFIFPALKLYNNHYPNTDILKLINLLKMGKFQNFYFRAKLGKIDIFEDQWPSSVGPQRFLNLFFLSPAPFSLKMTVFFYPPIWKAFLRIFRKRLIFWYKLTVFRLKNRVYSYNPQLLPH